MGDDESPMDAFQSLVVSLASGALDVQCPGKRFSFIEEATESVKGSGACREFLANSKGKNANIIYVFIMWSEACFVQYFRENYSLSHFSLSL